MTLIQIILKQLSLFSVNIKYRSHILNNLGLYTVAGDMNGRGAAQELTAGYDLHDGVSLSAAGVKVANLRFSRLPPRCGRADRHYHQYQDPGTCHRLAPQLKFCIKAAHVSKRLMINPKQIQMTKIQML